MTVEDLAAIGRRWIEAWNSHDLERVLALYDEDAEMSSAGIVRLGINDAGRVKGKDNLRTYWARALAQLPDLHFDLLDLSVSPDSVVVRYVNDRSHTVSEFLRVNAAGQIVQGSSNRRTP